MLITELMLLSSDLLPCKLKEKKMFNKQTSCYNIKQNYSKKSDPIRSNTVERDPPPDQSTLTTSP